jgi:hypothetical protein
MFDVDITETGAVDGCRCFWVTLPGTHAGSRTHAAANMSGYAQARGLGRIALIKTDGEHRFLYSVAAKAPGRPPVSADLVQRDVTGATVYVHVPETDADTAFIQAGDAVRLLVSTQKADRPDTIRTITDLHRALDILEAHLRAFHHADRKSGHQR